MLDILVVGAGPAGLTAALYARRAGLSVAVYERLFSGGQMASTAVIENYPGFASGIGGADLALAMDAQVRALGVPIVYGEIDKLELGTPHAIVSCGGRRTARALILCMGARPRPLGVPGEERYAGNGVSYCATCDGALYAGKPVAVIGGGNAAAEDALHLARVCPRVHLVHRRSVLRAEAELSRRVTETPRIVVHWDREVREIAGSRRVEALSLKTAGGNEGEAERIPVDGVFIAVGREPQNELVRGRVACDASGYIVASEDTRTSWPRVYAAGDIRRKPLRQIVTAVADGAVAVWAALQDL